MNSLDKQYTDLLQTILDYGVEKKDRTGTGTKSIFGYTIRHNMKEGFPLLTTKKMYFKGIVTELLWFLRGDTNIKYLVDNDCHIWDGDAYKSYLKNWKPQPVVENELHWMEQELVNDRPLPKDMFIHCIKKDDEFANKWGELGPVYGKQWRSWDAHNKWDIDPEQIDQISNLINDLKTNPDSRRLMVSAWNVGELEQMTLPPCHYGFQVYTRELSLEERNDLLYKKIGGEHKRENCFSDEEFERETLQDCKAFNIPTRAISLMWNQRSVDTFLGLPFNIASYGLLLEIIAKEVNMVPDQLIGNLGDTHLYLNHIEQAKEQIGRELTYDEKVNEARKRFGFDHPEGFRTFDINTKESIEFLQSKQHTREPYPLPKLMICGDMTRTDSFTVPFDELDHSLIKLIDYQSHPTIKAPLSN